MPLVSSRSFVIVLALLGMWAIFAYLTHGTFLSARNLSNLSRQTAVTGILAIGMVMIIVTANIDLSVGSLVGLSGLVSVLTQTTLHWGLLPSLAAGLLAGLAVGILQGTLVAYLRIPSFIVTLGGLLAWRGATKGASGGNTFPIKVESFRHIGQSYLSPEAGWILAIVTVLAIVVWTIRRRGSRSSLGLASWTPVETGLRIIAPTLLVVGFLKALNSYAGVPVPVVILLLSLFAATVVMQNTRFGRHLYAIGGNVEAARLSGIDPRRNVLAAFCVMGVLAAVAGTVYTARVGSASPDAGTLLELDAIAACVIGGASLAGGRGTVVGACLGALFMASLDNGMSLQNVPDFIQDIVKGFILVLAVGIDMVQRRSN